MIGRSVEAPEHSRVARHAHNLQPRVRIYLSSFISSLSLHEIFRSWHAGRQAGRSVVLIVAHFFPRCRLTLISCTHTPPHSR